MTKVKSTLIDSFICCLLALFSWFIFSSSLQFQYFNTGYQDWMSHAFRIREVSQYGITSWTHSWSNGLNFWKMYQYIPHFLTYFIQRVTGGSITHSMIVITWLILLVFMTTSYAVLRFLRIGRLAAVISIFVVLTSPTVWLVTRDFSIFFSLLYVPFFMAILIYDFKHSLPFFRVGALAGISWAIHPLLGAFCSTLFGFYLLIKFLVYKRVTLLLPLIPFFISSLLFTSERLVWGYHFIALEFSSLSFLHLTMSQDYLGFGLITLIGLAISWFGMFAFSGKIPMWSKILTIYTTIMICIIELMLIGLAPAILYTLQLARSVPLLSLCILFSVAPIAHQILLLRSRFFSLNAVALLAILGFQVIQVSSIQLPPATNRISDPVSQYFKEFPLPNGSVWIADVSTSSFFSPDTIHFATSYNGHLEPHPLSPRLNNLMKNDLAFTGISKKQVDLINSYSRVLDIEYLFLPRFSPLVQSVASESAGPSSSYRLSENQVKTSEYVALHNDAPTAHAYLLPSDTELLSSPPALPTLSTQSWAAWDNAITSLDKKLKVTAYQKIQVLYPSPEDIELVIPTYMAKNQGILLIESYDPDWKASLPSVKIQPTNTRFMYITPPEGFKGTLMLHHSWKSWHWPVQILSLGFGLWIFLAQTAWVIFRARKESYD